MRLQDYLEYWAHAAPDRLCLSDGTRSFTYRQVNEWADRVAAVFTSLGVTDNDRVGVLAKNCADWVSIYYGAFKSGVVPVPLNFRLHPKEWAFLLRDSEATAILAQEQYTEDIDTLGDELPAALGAQIVIDGPRKGWLNLSDLVAAAESAPSPWCVISTDHDLWQMYTSGTTGLPKGAVLTHAAVHANMIQLRTAVPVHPDDNRLIVMPLYHAGAALSMVQVIAAGASMRIMAKFDPDECVRVLEEERITQTSLVPAMIQAMLVEVPDIRERRFESLRAISYGAAPIAEETLRQALDVFACGFQQGFGQTESSAGITVLDIEAHRRALAGDAQLLRSCGRPLVGTELAVVDGEGKPVQPGEVGEIIARGPQMMRGYWNLPEATAKTLSDGWLHTGDAGHVDDEGFVYVSDRLKDMIVSGGENVYPREIEEIIFQMPDVADAAVIGVPDERWGESVKAIVVVKPGQTLTEEKVIAWCRGHLAAYKAPRSVDFLEALPRNPSGKVLKRELRAPYWRDRERQVS